MEMTSNNMDGVPLPRKFIEKQFLRRFFSGEISAQVANTELLALVEEPESFFEIWFEYYGKPNPLRSIFVECTEKLDAIVRQYQKLLENANTERAAFQLQKNEIANVHKEIIRRQKELGVKATLAPLKFANFPDPRLLVAAGIDQMNFGSVPEALSANIKAYLRSVTSGKKIQRSDMADLVHSAYLAHVDLWRGDRSFSEMLFNAQVPHASRIVSSITDLPRRIQELRLR